jgi:NADH:ubiquinone oxidoreductase subunit 6 (subunit J)
MPESDFQDADHEQSPQASPRRSGLQNWNIRATIALAVAMLTASTGIYSRQLPFIVAILVFILFGWALLYGVFSAGLWTWRLITNNPSDKPLWNRLATISVLVGLFFAIFSVLGTLYGPVVEPPEVLTFPLLAPMSALSFLLFTCFSYGFGAAVKHIRKRQKMAQQG